MRTGTASGTSICGDRRGEHARFEFDLSPIQGIPRHCVLEMAHARSYDGGQARDLLVAGFSTLVCTNRVPYDALGEKRLFY